MRDWLAEKLLAEVLQWTPEDVAQERPILQALAAYKYDEYLQFSAGSRFIENLALWLVQFETPEERHTAYAFMKGQLVFCSAAEMRHLVEIAYPDHIRTLLLDRTAGNSPDRFRPATVATRTDFKVRQRQCLFLGLSDGARIDAFRRANRDLNHEQIWQSYELSEQRVTKLLGKLSQHLEQITGRVPDPADCRFQTLVLLDDFSASGTSYYTLPATCPGGGKITDFLKDLSDETKPVARLVDLRQLEVIILLYLATEQAIEYLGEASKATWVKRGIPCTVEVVQLLPKEIRLVRGGGNEIDRVIEHSKYYDHDIYDEHFAKGRTPDARYGYADCGLPLVLHHNTPNNSVALLMSYEGLKFRGLFPRIQRHKEMS
ncbi:MAG: hypothetical protein JO112_02145 [Planctomycetes bacterium]|nr:hypothetical protein [Planctomycetota bacterium]